MTLTDDRPPAGAKAAPQLAADLPSGTLDRRLVRLWAVAAVALAAAFTLLLAGLNLALLVIAAFVIYTVGIYVASRRVEGHRRATDRLVTAFVTTMFLLVVVPLVSVIWTVVENGVARLDTEFFTEDMRSVVGDGGGARHAILGTLIITGIAAAISVPVGLLVSIYLVEYGRGRLARAVTTMVDVMTGIPSIVAGLFAYSLFVLWQGAGARSGLAGGVALSVLMTPVVIRASVEMLRLVPNELREASYALGVPKWLTIVRIVLPTAVAGLFAGVTLAIARVIGETAPLLLVAGLAQSVNTNPLEGRMTTLPVMAYYGYQSPGTPPQFGYERGWTAALVLVLVVAILFLLARVATKVLQPKGLR